MALRMMEGDDRRLTKSQVVPKFSVETELAAEEIRTGFLEFTISNIGQRSNQNVLTVFDIVGLVSISSLKFITGTVESIILEYYKFYTEYYVLSMAVLLTVFFIWFYEKVVYREASMKEITENCSERKKPSETELIKEKLETNLLESQRDFLKLRQTIAKERERFQTQVNKYKSTVSDLQKTVKELRKYDKTKCSPNCKANIDLSSLKSKLKTTERNMITQNNTHLKELSKLEHIIEAKSKDLRSYSTKNALMKSDISNLEVRVKSYEKVVIKNDPLDRALSDLDEKERRIESLKLEIHDILAKLNISSARIIDLEELVSESKTEQWQLVDSMNESIEFLKTENQQLLSSLNSERINKSIDVKVLTPARVFLPEYQSTPKQQINSKKLLQKGVRKVEKENERVLTENKRLVAENELLVLEKERITAEKSMQEFEFSAKENNHELLSKTLNFIKTGLSQVETINGDCSGCGYSMKYLPVASRECVHGVFCLVCRRNNKCSLCPRDKRVKQKKVLGKGLLVDPVTQKRNEEELWNFYSQMLNLSVGMVPSQDLSRL